MTHSVPFRFKSCTAHSVPSPNRLRTVFDCLRSVFDFANLLLSLSPSVGTPETSLHCVGDIPSISLKCDYTNYLWFYVRKLLASHYNCLQHPLLPLRSDLRLSGLPFRQLWSIGTSSDQYPFLRRWCVVCPSPWGVVWRIKFGAHREG